MVLMSKCHGWSEMSPWSVRKSFATSKVNSSEKPHSFFCDLGIGLLK